MESPLGDVDVRVLLWKDIDAIGRRHYHHSRHTVQSYMRQEHVLCVLNELTDEDGFRILPANPKAAEAKRERPLAPLDDEAVPPMAGTAA